AGGEEHVGGAGHVDRPEQVAVAGQGHLGDVVQDDVDALARGPQRVEVADVAGDVVDVRLGPGGSERAPGPRRVQVEDPDLVTPRQGEVGEDRAEVAAAPGDQDGAGHQS